MLKRVSQTALCCFLLLSGSGFAARLAIVIDDIGYRADDQKIYNLPKEISVAIIPSAPNAMARAKQAKQQARDILIHQPMQPKAKMKLEKEGLLLGMSAEQVANNIEYARQKVPYAIGLNNHMGSAATADRTLMTHLMQQLQRHKLFFLDSRTIGSSVAIKVARENGVVALDRHIFLDDSDDYADVQRQFNLSLQYARKHGTAIVIGHPRKNTIKVLQQGIANLPQDIQLVGMGSLWRNEKVIPPKPFILLFNDLPASTSVAPFIKYPLLRGVPE
ncbi:divergent polysaccharide deacetylase family protein [Testudinibacter aquarius]|uniref:Divergent polysaccharide deacetylase family protein n=1 Tax=Testudinibacter aquarius TaxID=1524974 RepID=A0A4V2W196_9PAST|nr:divergent polysaccharide deacetylase family protein [Testudinibacter aquarius]KAE9531001.1 hypothetical protein A1D24_05625 [Testudinibacter aquarius]TCV83359.1 hypothetical protein EDC16_11538 [Testudinibacter aquarius]TNG91181.1 divergent polysaccharide deacetylase family protein [Testudinibacter aquarius]